jgi:hypothetical protein
VVDDGEHIVNEWSTLLATGEPLDVEADLRRANGGIAGCRAAMCPSTPIALAFEYFGVDIDQSRAGQFRVHSPTRDSPPQLSSCLQPPIER